MAKLRPKQKAFVKAYAKTLNATQAAKDAGYSKKTARVIGQENLLKPAVKAEVEKTVSKQIEKAELSAQMVLDQIKRLAFADLTQAYNEDGSIKLPHEMPEDVRAALQSYESEEIITRKGVKIGDRKKFRAADKNRSLEMLAKHFKLLTDMVESSNKTTIVVASEEQVKAALEKLRNEI